MTTSFKFERSEHTRQSFYTCIKYASKFIKLRPELRKSHPAALQEKLPVVSVDDDDETTLYDDKDEKRMTWLRNESQLIYPSRFPGNHHVPEITIEDEEEQEIDSSDFDPEDYVDDSESECDDATDKNEAYFKAWRKLSGYTLQSDEPKTAVLITLSPSALAAANVAKLRRKRVHTIRDIC